MSIDRHNIAKRYCWEKKKKLSNEFLAKAAMTKNVTDVETIKFSSRSTIVKSLTLCRRHHSDYRNKRLARDSIIYYNSKIYICFISQTNSYSVVNKSLVSNILLIRSPFEVLIQTLFKKCSHFNNNMLSWLIKYFQKTFGWSKIKTYFKNNR